MGGKRPEGSGPPLYGMSLNGGAGTKAASFSINSSGSKIRGMVTVLPGDDHFSMGFKRGQDAGSRYPRLMDGP